MYERIKRNARVEGGWVLEKNNCPGEVRRSVMAVMQFFGPVKKTFGIKCREEYNGAWSNRRALTVGS